MSTKEYIAVIEQAQDGSFSAYVPDLPGCVTCGDTVELVQQLIGEAIALHIESLRNHGDDIPRPSAITIAVPAA
jgi:predicted RNase H-like HicB family nuclease